MTNIKPNYNQNEYPVEPESNLNQNQDFYGTDKAVANQVDTNKNGSNHNHTSYDRVLKSDKHTGSDNPATGLLVGIGALSVAALVVGTMFLPGLLKQKENEPAVIPSQTESTTTESNTTIIEKPVVIPGSETEGTSGVNTLDSSETLPVDSLSEPGNIDTYTTTPSNEGTSLENPVDSSTQSAPTSDIEGSSNNFESSPAGTTQEYPSIQEPSTSEPTLSPSGSESNNNYDASGATLENPSTISPESSNLESNPDYTTGGENSQEYPSNYDSTTTSPESSNLESNPNNFDSTGEVTLPGNQTTGGQDTYTESEQ